MMACGVDGSDDRRPPGNRRVDGGATSQMTQESDGYEEAATDDHLADVEDGCGCAEVWEHLSESRAADD